MCFSIIAGKQTTADGHVLIGVNNDWPGYPGRIHHAPARSHPPGSRHWLTGGIEIPQVERTFAYTYTTTAYETGHLPESWWGGVNENQVAVGMQGVYAFKSCETSPGLEADDLTILILERGKTARQSIEMLGELIAEYGFSVSSIEGAAGCANIAIADPEEGFFFEIAPGGHWCAKRVEDDEAEVRPNCFGIQTVDFDDPIRFMWSEHLVQHAVEQGWYDPSASKPFNFHEAYSNNDPICVYGKADDPVNAHRRWRALNIISGAAPDPDILQYSARANRPLTVRDICDLITDSSEGSRFDLSLEPGAGPHANPFWMETSTSIGQSGTVVSMVVQLRGHLPADIGTVAWFAYSNAHISPFIPCYFGSEGLPPAYGIGTLGQFDSDAAWWVFQELGQLCYRNYTAIANQWIIPITRAFENDAMAVQPDLDAVLIRLYEKSPERARRLMRTYVHAQAAEALETARRLSLEIKGRYLANTVIS